VASSPQPFPFHVDSERLQVLCRADVVFIKTQQKGMGKETGKAEKSTSWISILVPGQV